MRDALIRLTMLNSLRRPLLAVLGLCAAIQAPALAQYIPPHSNDPHPPANQPAYQLPSPLSRPGVPQYPGAAHSNDPHYRKNESVITWPTTPFRPDTRFPSTPPQYSTQIYPRSSGRAPGKKDAEKARATKSTLQECYTRWYANVGMSQESWARNCRRLAAQGRLRVR